MPTTPAQKTQYQSELSTLEGQVATKRGELDTAHAALEGAHATHNQRLAELALLEQRAQDRRLWISN